LALAFGHDATDSKMLSLANVEAKVKYGELKKEEQTEAKMAELLEGAKANIEAIARQTGSDTGTRGDILEFASDSKCNHD